MAMHPVPQRTEASAQMQVSLSESRITPEPATRGAGQSIEVTPVVCPASTLEPWPSSGNTPPLFWSVRFERGLFLPRATGLVQRQ